MTPLSLSSLSHCSQQFRLCKGWCSDLLQSRCGLLWRCRLRVCAMTWMMSTTLCFGIALFPFFHTIFWEVFVYFALSFRSCRDAMRKSLRPPFRGETQVQLCSRQDIAVHMRMTMRGQAISAGASLQSVALRADMCHSESQSWSTEGWADARRGEVTVCRRHVTITHDTTASSFVAAGPPIQNTVQDEYTARRD